MKKIFFLMLLFIFTVCNKVSLAQDVPDLQLATLIQQECPTCIDLPTQNLLAPALTLDSLNLSIGVCVLNFQGLELFNSLISLKIDFPDPTTFSDCYINANGNNNIPIPYLPPNLEYLKITSFGSPSYNGNFNITLPTTLKELYLEGININISSFPTTLNKLSLTNLNYNFGTYPASLKEMEVYWATGGINFFLPSSVERLSITDWYGWDVTMMGNLVPFDAPNSNLRYLRYDGESNFAGNYDINLADFPLLDTLDLYEGTLLESGAIPPSIKYLAVTSTSSSWNFLSNLPIMLKSLIITANNSILNVPVLPDDLQKIEIKVFGSTDTLTFSSPLPNALKNLKVWHDIPVCFPTLPQGLLSLNTNFFSYNGQHGCIPNLPPQAVVSHYSTIISNPPICATAAPVCLTYESPIVRGSVFFDLNNNGLLDNASEPKLAQTIIRETIPTSSYSYIYSNTTSAINYYDFIDTSTSYIYDMVNTYANYATPAAGNISTNSSSGQVFPLNFAFAPAFSFDDVEVWYAYLLGNQSGYYTHVAALVRNRGTNAVTGTFKGTLGNFLSINNPGGGTVTGNEILWNFSLNSGADKYYFFDCNVSPSAQIGDTLNIDFEATINGTDYNPNNNLYTANAPVVSSYDPNEIKVDKTNINTQQVQQGSDLTYTINFQNTGNAPAINIFLTDSLSEYLDPAYFQVLLSSHLNYEIQLLNTNNPFKPYMLKVIYNNINLPDSSSNEAGSKGFFIFKIRVKSNTVMGTTIPAKADIYFDYNTPIFTNQVNTLVIDPSKTFAQNNTSFDCNLSPNPANETIVLAINSQSEQYVQLEIIDCTGKQIENKNVKIIAGANTITANLERFSKGIYFVKIISKQNNLLYAGKFIKQ